MDMHHCSGGTCSQGGHDWQGSGDQAAGCCQETSCSCGCGAPQNCPAGDLFDTVKCAKKSLLKEKIKERLEKHMGKKLDAMADFAVEMLMAKHAMKKDKKMKMQEMMERMHSMMAD